MQIIIGSTFFLARLLLILKDSHVISSVWNCSKYFTVAGVNAETKTEITACSYKKSFKQTLIQKWFPPHKFLFCRTFFSILCIITYVTAAFSFLLEAAVETKSSCWSSFRSCPVSLENLWRRLKFLCSSVFISTVYMPHQLLPPPPPCPAVWLLSSAVHFGLRKYVFCALANRNSLCGYVDFPNAPKTLYYSSSSFFPFPEK